MKIAIVGASGYGGAELSRILSDHPEAEITCLTAHGHAGEKVGSLYPNLEKLKDRVFESYDLDRVVDSAEFVIYALPHGLSMSLVGDVLAKGVRVLDLAGDLRLTDPQDFKFWYGEEHASPGLLNKAVYGLPEHFGAEIAASEVVACPGCYPTSILLPLVPFVKEGIIAKGSVVINSLSGVSGAGRELSPKTHFSEVNGSLAAYAPIKHKHISEIEMVLEGSGGCGPVEFTPHLVPVTRGIISTITFEQNGNLDETNLRDVLLEAYDTAPFVDVLPSEELPATKSVTGTNKCKITLMVNPRTGRVKLISVIDNLIKGAAGQAVQNLNIMGGYPETTGLNFTALHP